MKLRKWTTADMPARERFGAWRDTLSATHLDWDLVGTEPDFHADVTERRVNDLRLVGCRCDPCEGFRASDHLARQENDYIGILFELAGSELVRQGDREATLSPGDFVIWDSRHQMEFRVLEPLKKITILVPRTAMRRFLPEVDAIVGMCVEGADGLGPLVGAHLRQLSAALETLEDRDLRLVTDTTLELVSAGLRPKLESLPFVGGDLFDRLRAYIDERLPDPELSPSQIAEENKISVRYLHKIFSSRGQSVSRWIQKQRLYRCRRALEQDARERSITDIAFAWGFNDTAHFSRSFRAEFGTSPREFRKNVHETDDHSSNPL